MNKIKAFAVTALAAATIAVGGLVAAPSASAQPNRGVCDGMARKGQIAMNLGTIFYGLGDWGRRPISMPRATALTA